MCSLLKKVMNTHTKLYCGLCCKYSHLNCSGLRKSDFLHNSCANYISISCSVENFPLNYIEDCFEFNNVLHNFFNDFLYLGILFLILSNHQFFVIRVCYIMLMLIQIVFFDQLHTSCNYYLPSDVRNTIVKLELKNQLLILHVNARSLEKKLNILSILIKSLNVNVDIIAVSETWETVSNSN